MSGRKREIFAFTAGLWAGATIYFGAMHFSHGWCLEHNVTLEMFVASVWGFILTMYYLWISATHDPRGADTQ